MSWNRKGSGKLSRSESIEMVRKEWMSTVYGQKDVDGGSKWRTGTR